MRKEDYFIWLLAVHASGEGILEEAEAFVRESLDWDYIITRSQAEKVACLIFHYLKSSQLLELLPEGSRNSLDALYYAHCAHNALIYEEFKKTAAVLKKEEIVFVVLKGLILAANVYENIGLRPMNDMDFLVKEEDIFKSAQALEKLGYRPTLNVKQELNNRFAYSISLVKEYQGNPSFFSIDLHWHIFNSSWMMGLLASKVDVREIWGQTRTVVIDGNNVFTLSAPQFIISLCQNALNHGFARLIMLADVIRVMDKYKNDIDLDLLKRQARVFGLSNVLEMVLSLAQSRGKLAFRRYQRLKRIRFYGFPALFYLITIKGVLAKIKTAFRLVMITVIKFCS